MIGVKRETHRRVCESCYTDKDVFQISLGDSIHAMHSIAICAECFDKIMLEIESYQEKEDCPKCQGTGKLVEFIPQHNTIIEFYCNMCTGKGEI